MKIVPYIGGGIGKKDRLSLWFRRVDTWVREGQGQQNDCGGS